MSDEAPPQQKQPVEPAPQAATQKRARTSLSSLDSSAHSNQGMTFKECAECPMVVIPAGTFVLGSPTGGRARMIEGPQTNITFARPFAVSKFEVTVEQFTAFMDSADA